MHDFELTRQSGVYFKNASWNKKLFWRGPDKLKGEKWRISFPQTLTISRPVIDEHHNIIFGTNDGRLICVSKLGEVIWTRNFGEHILSSPVITADGDLVVAKSRESGRSYLCKLNSNGNVIWVNPIGQQFRFEPVLDLDGNHIVATDQGVCKIDSKGDTLWTYNCRKISSSPIYDLNNNIYFSSRADNGSLISLAVDGSLRWRKEVGKCFLQDEPVVDQDGLMYMITSEKNLHSLYSFNSEGRIECRYSPQDRGIISSSALSNDGFLVMGTTFFKVISVNLSGELLWETDLGQTTQFTPILDVRNNIYLYTYVKKRKTKSNLWVLNQNGEILWNYEIKGAILWFHFNSQNGLMVMTIDSDTYLLELVSYDYE